MMTINEVSKLSGVSARTLRYYDELRLLCPAKVTEVGYRLYSEENLLRLQQILLFRELEFPLKDIKSLLDNSSLNAAELLTQQIKMLEAKKEHIEQLIYYAKGVKTMGAKKIDFKVFDAKKQEEYAHKAQEQWGNTDAYKEYAGKAKDYSQDKQKAYGIQLMAIFTEFGKILDQEPTSEEAQFLVKKLQNFITEHYYTCTKQILIGLGQMYHAGGEMTDNINNAGGAGTAEFAAAAIEYYCR